MKDLTPILLYNNRRLLRPIGDVPPAEELPAEFEMMYRQQTESSNVA